MNSCAKKPPRFLIYVILTYIFFHLRLRHRFPPVCRPMGLLIGGRRVKNPQRVVYRWGLMLLAYTWWVTLYGPRQQTPCRKSFRNHSQTRYVLNSLFCLILSAWFRNVLKSNFQNRKIFKSQKNTWLKPSSSGCLHRKKIPLLLKYVTLIPSVDAWARGDRSGGWRSASRWPPIPAAGARARGGNQSHGFTFEIHTVMYRDAKMSFFSRNPLSRETLKYLFSCVWLAKPAPVFAGQIKIACL